jgi:hypothetical protein
MSDLKNPAVIAAAIRPGYKIGFVVHVDGKEILSRGEVFGFRRVGHDKAEITLMHFKTGSLFTNVLPANAPVVLLSIQLDEQGDAFTKLVEEQVMGKLKEQASEFFSLMQIED